MTKAKLNYLLDWVIGLAFALSTATGVVLWLAGSGGYQGGRNPAFRTTILGISRGTWSDLHIWVSLVLVAGVVAHFLLHWDWFVCMTKRLLRPSRRKEREACPIL
ncbi:MAG TPA: DUF4405 domain-containing protein [Thermoflexia bacterium]|jgi:hypothetical protein|nr:DUF4405 domain-containing protein [Thermoflexia bacterium]